MSQSRRICLVTGATGVLGKAFCGALLSDSWTVLAGGRDKRTLEELASALEAPAGRFVPIAFDLERTDLAALASDLAARGLMPHALVNNARDVANLADAQPWPSRAAWLAEYALGVVAAVELAVALAQSPGSRLDSVVNVASIYGMVVPDPAVAGGADKTAPIHYGCAKAALVHASRELAVRLAPRVRVNSVSYGGVAGRADAAFAARYAARAPQGRMLDASDVPGAVLFLLSRASAGVTGHNLVVDGGWTLW